MLGFFVWLGVGSETIETVWRMDLLAPTLHLRMYRPPSDPSVIVCVERSFLFDGAR